MNFGVWTKLAEAYLKEGIKDRAHASFVGAARALTKSGDLRAAMASYKRAAQLNPVNREAMKGFLEVSLQSGDLSGIIDQLKKSLVVAADDVALLEMLGIAQLANKDFEDASKTFGTLVSLDEARYGHFFSLCDAYSQLGDYDRAAQALDTIVPILITRRETERAVEAYQRILKANPEHILSLRMLASLFASTGDQVRQLETLEKVAVLYLSQQCPREALDHLEVILQIRPEDEKYLNLHRQAFEEAYPGTPYSPPAPPPVVAPDIAGEFGYGESTESQGVQVVEEQAESDIVEIDLLMNYGMTEKALNLLLPMEQRDPANVEVRTRMLTLYRESKQDVKAAEECLCLAALYHNAGDEAGATKMMSEAQTLAPQLVDSDFDLQTFALQHGITAIGTPVAAIGLPPPVAASQPREEVDLSEDLSALFTTGFEESQPSEEMAETPQEPEAIVDEIARQIPRRSSAEAIQAQFQEVDFYIRLGFHDEARAKLDEVARESPNNPELALRYRQLEEAAVQQPDKPIALGPGEIVPGMPVETTPPDGGDIFEELKIDRAADSLVENYTSESIARKSEIPAEVPAAAQKPLQEAAHGSAPAGKVNAMFADLLDEVNSLTDRDIAQGDFETHFNLGIAYRGMALIDESIKEFQTAVKILDPVKSPKEVIQCCGMLSTCFIEKGMPRSAIRWCQTGLTIKDISPHEVMALRYDMGVAHALIGEQERALECFTAIFSKDPSYRDVAQKIDDLKAHS
jgi:tetratricopeptide (TPR) repeat protein